MGKRFKMERFFKFEKCMASKGLTGALFGCVARKGVTGEILVSVQGLRSEEMSDDFTQEYTT